MKKNIFSLGLIAVAALTLATNCTKNEALPSQEEQPVISEGVPFAVFVSSSDEADTKTTNSVLNTEWAANDAINLFYADAGSTTYTDAGKFTTTETGISASFTGTISGELNETNDWYAFYPYSSYVTTPANDDAGYTTVGGAQTQADGATATAHLAGTKFPLYGKVTSVAKAATPTIHMKQAMSAVMVHVTNNSGAALTINTVTFSTEDYPINGQFYINFAGDTPTFTGVSEKTGKSSTLTVTGGKTIANGETADFYIGVAPFEAASGKKLTVAINDYSKDLTLLSNATFAAGKIKTLNFNYDKTVTPASLPFAIDGTGKSAVYASTDGLSANGLGSDYGDTHSPYFTKLDNTGDYIQLFYNEPAGKVSFGVKMIGGNTTSYIDLKGSADGVSFSDIAKFTISGAQNDVLNFSTTSGEIASAYRYLRLVFTKGANIGIGPFSVTKVSSDPEINAYDITNVPAAGATDSFTYEIANFAGDDIVVTTDGGVVTSATVDPSSKTVTYTVAPNYTASNRDGSITIHSDVAGVGADKVVSVSQLKSSLKVDGGTSNITVTIPYDETSATFTVSSEEFAWASEIAEETGMNLSRTPTNGDATASQTITVSSTTEATSTDQILGTVKVYRSARTAATDPQVRTITVKKGSTPSGVTYTKATTVSEGTFLICYAEGEKVITGAASTMPTVNVEIPASGVIAGSSTLEGYEFTITALTGDDAGYYSFKIGDKYIGYNSSTNFTAGAATVANDKYKWSIVIDSETGLATITCKDATTRYWGWNNSNGFKAYATSNLSTYPRPTLFKKD
mgnify:CR=1 FL=1